MLAYILRKVLTAEIYSQQVRKNLDLLEQGPRGILNNDDVSIVLLFIIIIIIIRSS